MSIAALKTASNGLHTLGRHAHATSRVRTPWHPAMSIDACRALRTDGCSAFGTFRSTVPARGAPGEETTRH